MASRREAWGDDADGLLLELAAAEDLAATLPSASRDRAMVERRIELLQQQLYLILSDTSEHATGQDGRIQAEEGRR